MAKKVELKERGTGKIMYPVVIPETMQLDKDVTLADIINDAKEGEALVKTENGLEFKKLELDLDWAEFD